MTGAGAARVGSGRGEATGAPRGVGTGRCGAAGVGVNVDDVVANAVGWLEAVSTGLGDGAAAVNTVAGAGADAGAGSGAFRTGAMRADAG